MFGFGALIAIIGFAQIGDTPARLPSGPAPVQVLARLNNTGGLELVVPYYEYRQERQQDGSVVYSPVLRDKMRTIALKEVRIYGADGKAIDHKKLPTSLDKQFRALCSADGKPVDPLHLLLVKEGTLIFTVPNDSAQEVPRVHKE